MKSYNKLLAKLMMSSALVLTAGLSTAAYAVSVSPIVKSIAANTASENFVTVRNTKKDDVEYIQMDLFRIMNPGQAEREILEPELEKMNPGIVFSPTRLVLQPGKERKVRMVPMKAVAHEEVFRLRVISAQPPEDPSEVNSTKKNAVSAITMNIGYDVLIRLLPAGRHIQEVSVDCSAGHYKLRATGNVRSELSNIVADGVKLDRFNIYPTHERALTQSKTLSFALNDKTYNYRACVLEK